MTESHAQLAAEFLSEARTFRLRRAATALVLVDMQYASASREAGLGHWLAAHGRAEEGAYRFCRIEEVVLPNLRQLLDFFRKQGLRVIHVCLGAHAPLCADLTLPLRRVEHLIGNYVGTKEFEILNELAPLPGESVVAKLSASAFTSSNLDVVIKNLGVEQLVIGGVSTSYCIDMTARDAADRGYQVVIVEDGCAEDEPALHEASLGLFRQLFGRVESTATVLGELEKDDSTDVPSLVQRRRACASPRASEMSATRGGLWGDRALPGPLSGLKVIDAGTTIAGPFTAALLADFGADVIKIEKPGFGDPMRQWAPMKDGLSLWWKVIARNKRLITLDLSVPAGKQVFLELVKDADIVVENFRPGTFERWGLGRDVLSECNPGLVLVRVSGYGQTGPYRDKPGYGTAADAMSGIPSFTGFPDKPPTFPAIPLADTVAGCFGALGALGALYERNTSGQGDEVDVSLYEPIFRLAESQVITFDQLGRIRQRMGNRIEGMAPRNTYETADGKWIALSAGSDRTFERLARAIGLLNLVTDAKFATNPARIENSRELDEILAGWIAQHTSEEVLRTFDEHDVVAARVYDIEDIFADPHYAARGSIVQVDDADFGKIHMPAVVPRFWRTKCLVRRSGAALGEDNDFIFREVLGLGEADLRELKSVGVI